MNGCTVPGASERLLLKTDRLRAGRCRTFAGPGRVRRGKNVYTHGRLHALEETTALTLPGAFAGAIFEGVSPVEAGREA
jgi:hypothetical protein